MREDSVHLQMWSRNQIKSDPKTSQHALLSPCLWWNTSRGKGISRLSSPHCYPFSWIKYFWFFFSFCSVTQYWKTFWAGPQRAVKLKIKPFAATRIWHSISTNYWSNYKLLHKKNTYIYELGHGPNSTSPHFWQAEENWKLLVKQIDWKLD